MHALFCTQPALGTWVLLLLSPTFLTRRTTLVANDVVLALLVNLLREPPLSAIQWCGAPSYGAIVAVDSVPTERVVAIAYDWIGTQLCSRSRAAILSHQCALPLFGPPNSYSRPVFGLYVSLGTLRLTVFHPLHRILPALPYFTCFTVPYPYCTDVAVSKPWTVYAPLSAGARVLDDSFVPSSTCTSRLPVHLLPPPVIILHTRRPSLLGQGTSWQLGSVEW